MSPFAGGLDFSASMGIDISGSCPLPVQPLDPVPDVSGLLYGLCSEPHGSSRWGRRRIEPTACPSSPAPTLTDSSSSARYPVRSADGGTIAPSNGPCQCLNSGAILQADKPRGRNPEQNRLFDRVLCGLRPLSSSDHAGRRARVVGSATLLGPSLSGRERRGLEPDHPRG